MDGSRPVLQTGPMSTDLPAGAPRAAVLDDYQGVALASGPWEKLAGRLQVEVYTDHLADPVDLVARLAPFEVVVAMRERTRFDRQVIESLPHLRLLVTTGARNAAIDMAACARQGITVCGTGGLGHGTAELTWALILAAVRHLPTELASVRSGGWMTKVGGDLVGSCLGVVGLGRLGTQVARVGQAFGMDVVAWSPHLTEARAAEVGVQAVSKEELFARSDVVSIHLVLSESTQGRSGRPSWPG